MQDPIRHLNSSEAYGVFLSHGATPRSHPLIDGFSMTSSELGSTPHDYGNPHI